MRVWQEVVEVWRETAERVWLVHDEGMTRQRIA